jgi:Uma2 family endonuclease
VLTNDSGVITGRDPDTVRGVDVCYYSHGRVPRGTLPRDRYLDIPPDLVAEILSPEDRWPRVLRKVVEYLTAGVGVVLVVDTERRTVHVYEGEAPVRIVEAGQVLRLPTLFGDGFAVELARLF